MAKNYFQTRFTYDPDREHVWKHIASYLSKDIPKKGKVLELGAGYCAFINNVKASEKHALDVSDIIRKFANKDVTTHVQSAVNMKKFRADYFDAVLASNFFEHLYPKQFQKTIMEIRRILKPGGKLIIIQPNFRYSYREYFDDYTHVSMFTELSMTDVLESQGFIIKKCLPRVLPYTMKSRLKAFSFMAGIYMRSPIKPFAKQMLIIAQK